METISYTSARENFKKTMEAVCKNHAPIAITRSNAEPVVMMSLEDYDAMAETVYLLRSPRNAARLLEAMDDIEAGRYSRQELVSD